LTARRGALWRVFARNGRHSKVPFGRPSAPSGRATNGPPLIIYAFLMDYYIAGLTAGTTKG